MKNVKEILVIGLVLGVFLLMALIVVLVGTRGGKTHYVCIEVNPKIEMILDNKNIVKSVRPLNNEADTLLANENFVGEKIGGVVKKFMELCDKCGYLKYGEDVQNGVKVSVLSGFNQLLETKIVQSVNGYFVENNIYGCIIECPEDMQNYKDAKKYNVSAEHYDLALAVKDGDPSQDLKKLTKKSNKRLIEMIEQQHKNYVPEISPQQLADKTKLIDFNRENYENHKNSVTDKSTKEFKSKLEKYVKKNKKKYELNWESQYESWKNKENEVV